MSASNCPRLALPKPTPKLLEKRAKAADLKKRDEAERKKCRERSGGMCEVWEEDWIERHAAWLPGKRPPVVWRRCPRPASENHHLIFGSGRKNVGPSIEAQHRAHVCRRCHQELTAHILEPLFDVVTKARGLRVERVR